MLYVHLFKINEKIKLAFPIQFVNMDDLNILEYFRIFAFALQKYYIEKL